MHFVKTVLLNSKLGVLKYYFFILTQTFWKVLDKKVRLTLSFWTLKKLFTPLHTNFLKALLFSYGIGGKILE